MSHETRSYWRVALYCLTLKNEVNFKNRYFRYILLRNVAVLLLSVILCLSMLGYVFNPDICYLCTVSTRYYYVTILKLVSVVLCIID